MTDTTTVLPELAVATPSKILLIVIDGLGGVPNPDTGRTELETADLPNLDRLARESLCGIIDPVGPGITPGSGPGHLALFGYDPIASNIGRGALSALGIGFPLQPGDLAVRGNFATLDRVPASGCGNVLDRRAGRPSDEVNRQLVAKLRTITLPFAEVFVETESAHRFVLVLRGEGLSDELTDSDPQVTGVPPLAVTAKVPQADRSAELINAFVAQAHDVLRQEHPANGVLLRGFAMHPSLKTFAELYHLNPGCVAVYPMYKGLARLAGMQILGSPHTPTEELEVLRASWDAHDFLYMHFKAADQAGEDGAFDRKVAVLEELDGYVGEAAALEPDVLVVTGDHSTPALLGAHSWHPVPFLLRSRWAMADHLDHFDERHCARGSLGRFPGRTALSLMLAYALKLQKFGA